MSEFAPAATAPVPAPAFPPTPALDGLAARLPRLRGRLTPHAPLAPFTWFRVGGPAELMFAPADEDDLAYVLAELPAAVPVTVLGIASNVIVRDGGIPGLVVRLPAKGFGAIDVVSEREVMAGAAAPDRKVAGAAAEAGIGGLEFLWGIPGSIGGALRMNAGANGGETKDVVVYATGVTRDGDAVTLSNEEMGFRYRGVAVDPSVIFTGALLRGVPDDDLSIRARMEAVKTHRETAQPVREKTGGSTFKNPAGQSAWKLIDEAGCRGLRLGGAQVSEMHCNFLINAANATAADVEALGEEVRRRVREASGVELEWEIKRIGVDVRSRAPLG